MPGDYLFPKKLFKDGEPLETVELNSALQTAVERLNGHLGPHNIRAPLDPAISTKAETFFSTKTATTDVDSLLKTADSSAAGSSPDPAAAGVFTLEQETGWVPVTGGAEDMIVEMTTGSSALSITAAAAHCYAGGFVGVRAAFQVVVPYFDSPDLAYGDRDNAKHVTVRIKLGDGSGASYEVDAHFSEIGIGDLRNFASFQDQSESLARKIVEGGQTALTTTGSDARDIQDNGWGVKGWSVRNFGRTLIFTRNDVGPTTGTFEATFDWSGYLGARPRSVTRTMEERRAGSINTSANSKLSQLPSATLQNGVASSTAPVVLLYYPAQIQYALRVDGVVLSDTITGRFDNEQSPFAPARIVDPREGATDNVLSGPMVGRFRERPDAINIPMFSVRLTASIDVEPGDHVVELVVRRVPTGRKRSFTPPPPDVGNPDSDVIYLPSDSRVCIYSRQLAVTDLTKEPVTSALFERPTVVKSFSDEDVVSNQSLVVDKLQHIATESNDVDSFQIARGAINGDHLEGFSSVIASNSVSTVATKTVDTSAGNVYVYPPTSGAVAFGNGRFFHELPNSWVSIIEAPLVVDATPPVECVFTIEGNVFLRRLVCNSLQSDQMHVAAACFVIAVRAATSGTWYAWRPSIAWVNSNNYIAYQVDKTDTKLYTTSSTVGFNYLSRYGPNGNNSITESDVPGDFVDVPVTAYVDFTGLVAGTTTRALLVSIDRVGIWGAAAHMGRAGGQARFVTDRMSLNAVVMKS